MKFDEFARKRGLNVKKINATDHAFKRARERFGWNTHNDSQILGNLRNLLSKSVYIGEVIEEEHRKTSHMFVSERRGIYLNKELTEIVTVIMHEYVTHVPLKRVMLDLHKKELRKLDRKERSRLKHLESLRDDCDVDLAILKRRLKRTRSESIRLSCQAKINAIKQTVNEYEEEIKRIQNEKRAISRSLAAVL